MPDRFNDISRTGFSFCANHRRAFANPAQRFTEISSSAHKRNFELMFVDMMLFIGGRKHLAFIDEVHSEGFKELSFDEVSDTHFGHYRDRNGGHNLADFPRRSHSCDSA